MQEAAGKCLTANWEAGRRKVPGAAFANVLLVNVCSETEFEPPILCQGGSLGGTALDSSRDPGVPANVALVCVNRVPAEAPPHPGLPRSD